MNDELQTYFDNIDKPWNVLFYKVVWEQLSPMNHNKILDFGSGLGITANHLAKYNDVVAIEPNTDIAALRICENKYQQIIGDIEQLKQQDDRCFDVVLCHNVFEYAKERVEIIKEFCRVLKPGGTLSIVKHNHAGRVMQKVVFENNVDEALSLLKGRASSAAYFGEINYYEVNDIRQWISGLDIDIVSVLGIRTFWALHPDNAIRYDPNWLDKMFEIEMTVCNSKEFKNISFYNHVIFKKIL